MSYHWSFLLLFHHGNILVPLLSIQLRFQISNFRLQMYWWIWSTHAWDVLCVLHRQILCSRNLCLLFHPLHCHNNVFHKPCISHKRSGRQWGNERVGVAAGAGGKVWLRVGVNQNGDKDIKDGRVVVGPESAEQRWRKSKKWDMRWSLLGTQQDGKEMTWAR